MAEQKLEMKVSGMHCAACSTRIEKVVGNLAGVGECSVNLATELATLVFDPSTITLQDINDAIGRLGFSATSKPDANDTESEIKVSRKKLESMRSSLVPSFILAMLIMVISMGHMVGMSLPRQIDPSYSPFTYSFIQFLLVLPVLWMGRNFYLIGVPALLRGIPNMDSLIAMGTGAAFIYSSWNLVEITLGIDSAARAHDLYFESAAMLIALVSLGKYLEAKSKAKTTDAIRELMQLAPEEATLIKDGAQQQVPVGDIEVGDHILIHPGERVPVDGTIVDGHSSVDESMLTGESLPVAKNKGDNLFGGTLNKNGALTLLAEKVGEDTMLARIVRLVRDAQGSKAPIANLADRISLYFVPVVMVIATLAGLSWYFLGDAGFSYSLRIFIAVLVIACPCAMGLATPTSIMVGTGRGAQLGVLVKNGAVLELAGKIGTVVFDKTGTLTKGTPTLTDILVFGDFQEEMVLRLAAGSEMQSEHPLADALIEAAKEREYATPGLQSFTPVQGKGVEAELELDGSAYHVCLGNIELIEENGVSGVSEEIIRQSEQWGKEGKTVLYLAVNKEIAALLVLRKKYNALFEDHEDEK